MSGTRPDKAKLYHPRMPSTWWLKKPSYFLFMLRELSSVFIALFLVVYLVQIYQLTEGPDAYAASLARLRSTGWVIFHLIALVFALYHSITWFQSTAVILPVRIGSRAVSRQVITAVNIGAWIVVSVIIVIVFASF